MKTKIIHRLYWFSIPILFFWLFMQMEDEADLYLKIESGFKIIEGFSIWLFVSFYFFILGGVYFIFDSPKRRFFQSYFFKIFNTLTILLAHLFFLTMLENQSEYQLVINAHSYSNLDFYETKSKLFYFFFAIWMILQLVFWGKLLWEKLRRVNLSDDSPPLKDILDEEI